MTSVSPAYIIETSREVEFSKDVGVKMQHTANIVTEEDRQDLVVMKASNTHLEKDSVWKFEEMKGTKLELVPPTYCNSSGMNVTANSVNIVSAGREEWV